MGQVENDGTRPRFTRDEYLSELLRVYTVAKLLAELPLEQLAAMQDRAASIGAIVDPTLYMLKGQALEEDRRVTALLLRMKRDILKEIPHIRNQLPRKLREAHHPDRAREP